MNYRFGFALPFMVRTLSVSFLVFAIPGCPVICPSVVARRSLNGVVLDAQTLQPTSDVVDVDAFTFTDGEITGSGGGGFNVQPSLEDGSFELGLGSSETRTVCGTASPDDLPAFAQPDEILVTIKREACEQEFTIEINEDTVVDLSFPDDMIELKEPILLPPCGEEGSGE